MAGLGTERAGEAISRLEGWLSGSVHRGWWRQDLFAAGSVGIVLPCLSVSDPVGFAGYAPLLTADRHFPLTSAVCSHVAGLMLKACS